MNKSYLSLFPTLTRTIHDKKLVYFDNGASSLTLKSVIESESEYYKMNSSNVHRGIHQLSQIATNQFEQTRQSVAQFINAKSTDEIVFTKGTTDSLNLLASCLGQNQLNEGDEVLISTLEHHSNIIPWHFLKENKKIVIKEIPINIDGQIDLLKTKELITDKTKIISCTMASNTLGTITPYRELVNLAKENKVISILDAAQAAPHFKIDVQEIGCDYLVFSAHKMFGPSGVGVLFGRSELLNNLPPYQGGGGMIQEVSITNSTYLKSPQRFEAGTPNIAGVIAFKEAIDFLLTEDINKLEMIEMDLLNYAHEKLLSIEGLKIFGTNTTDKKVSVISFAINNIHPNDIGMLLDEQGIAIRTGHHCTQPLMKFLKITGTCRATLAFYNTKEEIDYFYNALLKVKSFF